MAISSLIVQALGIWILFVVVAIVNGAIREKLLVRLAGEYPAHLMAVLVLWLAVFAITGVFVRQTRISDAGILLVIGGLWLVLTIGFEFLFGHYVMGKGWSKLLGAYNIFNGDLWVSVLLVTFFSPLLSSKLLGH